MKTAIIAATLALGAFAIAVHDAQAWTNYNQNTQSVQVNPTPVFQQYSIPEHVRTNPTPRPTTPWYQNNTRPSVNCTTTTYGNTASTSCR